MLFVEDHELRYVAYDSTEPRVLADCDSLATVHLEPDHAVLRCRHDDQYALYLYRDGRTGADLVADDIDSSTAVWPSPDGRALVARTGVTGNYDYYAVFSASGKVVTLVEQGPRTTASPSWKAQADGHYAAYVSLRDADNNRRYACLDLAREVVTVVGLGSIHRTFETVDGDDYAYFKDTAAGTLVQLALADCTVEELASGLQDLQVRGLSADAQSVFFEASGAVWRAPLAGGTSVQVATGNYRFLVGDWLFFSAPISTGEDTTTAMLFTDLAGGGAATPLADRYHDGRLIPVQEWAPGEGAVLYPQHDQLMYFDLP
jgi:hypothetical protein